MKTVNTRLYLDEAVSILKEGHQISIPIKGVSMNPFLKENRDYAYLEGVDGKTSYKNGEILLFIRDNDQYVLHRLYRNRSDYLLMRGDNQVIIEPIKADQVKARVIFVKRNGKILKPGNLVWNFFAGPWNQILLIRKIAGFKSRLKRRSNEL